MVNPSWIHVNKYDGFKINWRIAVDVLEAFISIAADQSFPLYTCVQGVRCNCAMSSNKRWCSGQNDNKWKQACDDDTFRYDAVKLALSRASNRLLFEMGGHNGKKTKENQDYTPDRLYKRRHEKTGVELDQSSRLDKLSKRTEIICIHRRQIPCVKNSKCYCCCCC